jgi:exonuclease III
MESEFVVTKQKLRVFSWNTQRMGYDTPSKLLGFMKIIEKHKPDIIILQEAANSLVHLRGYNAHIALGATCGNYGTLIYISTELGQRERISEKKADKVHLCSP